MTADEEIGSDDGIEWLVRNHREAIDAAFCINGDGAGAASAGTGVLSIWECRPRRRGMSLTSSR
jgi:acetylornithine deacetylase/succinyl-diaminopimelate desuccinylase-like protein